MSDGPPAAGSGETAPLACAVRADCDGCGCADDGEEQKLRGAVFLAVGGGLTAVGVPLIVVGGRSVERNESRRAPEVMVGSRGASLRWHF